MPHVLAEDKRRQGRVGGNGSSQSNGNAAPVQGAQDSGAGRALTPAAMLAVQQSAGNRAAGKLSQRRPLQHPDFAQDPRDMSNVELLRAYRFDQQGDLMGIGLTPEDSRAVQAEMRRRRLNASSPGGKASPLDKHRDLMPTSGNVNTEIAKPAIAGGATGAGYGIAGQHATSSTAFMHATTGGGVGAEVFGGILLADAAMGMASGYKARSEALGRGDTAGGRLGSRKMKTAGWGMAGGSAGVAASGMKVGSAFGSTAAGLAAATGALGVVGGALTVAQGSWKIYMAARRLSDLGSAAPITDKGKDWKRYAEGREYRKAGVNALKVAAGALGIAAGALLIVSNPVGWAVGIAGLAVGGALALGKLGSKISDVADRRKAKKDMEKAGGFDALTKPQTYKQAQEDPGRRKEVHQLADQVAQKNSENARYAAAMVAAVKLGDETKLENLVSFRDKVFPSDKEFVLTREYLRGMVDLSKDDLERYDAEILLAALNVDREEALSESGQDLIQRKLSVADAT